MLNLFSLHNFSIFFLNHTIKITVTFFLILYIFIGIPHLGKFQTADEDLWFANPTEGRIHEYWRALKYGSWEDTRINDKPGVTTALLGGMLGIPYDQEPGKKMLRNGNLVDQFYPEYFETASFFYRLGIFLINGLLILMITWFIWKITEDTITTILSALFLYLSPILLGVSQIVNPDATLWSFGFAATMSYLAFIVKGNWWYILPSGLFFGFAILSKYTGSLLFFLFYLCTFTSFLFIGTSFQEKKIFQSFIIKRLFGYIILCIIAIATFAILMPAVLVETKYLYEGTFGFKGAQNIDLLLIFLGTFFGIILLDGLLFKATLSFFVVKKFQFLKQPLCWIFSLVLISGVLLTLFSWSGGNPLNFQSVPFDTGKGGAYRNITDIGNQIALQIKPVVYTITPIILIFFLFLLLYPLSFFQNKSMKDEKKDLILFFIFVFGLFLVAFFYAAIFQKVLVHVRYSILIYPFIFFLSALGGSLVLQFLWKKNKFLGIFSSAIIFFFILASLLADKPFYFNYTNDLLPYDQDIVGAWGYGGYEAAQYLNNTIPFPEYLVVWSDYDGFCPFFEGRCIEGSDVKWYKKGTFEGIDYFVVSRRGLIRNESSWKKINKNNIINTTPIWTLYIGDRPGNFIEIYEATKK
ncbi:MAG: phospholipid carrier-dependent glycosyltransferase [Candidatus Moranbacteria bacterium]|nr:phospholipid carrier-dependent glycosyltransferase [Candidatus Moranbacteria bacterium]